jgi:phage tail-like protein
MRGAGAVLANPFPMGERLPGLYQDDDFIQRFTSAFDEALAPAVAALDNLAAYLDPAVAPADFVEWLAGWVGVSLDENWPLERRRDLVAQAAVLYRRRGTAGALAEQVALYAGVVPEVVETGGVAWSAEPGGPLPGSTEARLTVRVTVPDPSAVDVRRLEAIVAEAKPAHIPATVEVVAG